VQLQAQDEKYDAVYLNLVKEYTLNGDGSMDYRYVKQQKLQTYRAFHNLYGETFVVYNPAFQELKINEVNTIMADGKKVPAPKNAFNEVLPGFAANAPAYNALREMVITHTALERNAIVNLDYQVHTRKGMFPTLMGIEALAEPEPVKNLEIRVRIPVGNKLFYKLFDSDLQPVKTTEGSYEVYSWKLKDVAAFSAEENQPGINRSYPHLVFSLSDKSDEVYSYLTAQPAFQFVLTEEMKQFVGTKISENRDKFKLALKLQEKVVNDFRYYPIPLRYALYQTRTPEQTWNSGGGTSLEKSVLLTAMLKYAGIDAQVAAFYKTPFHDSKVATLADVEDFAVKIEDGDRGSWLLSGTSLTSVNMNLTLPDRSFVVLDSRGKFSVTKSEEAKQTIKLIGNFIVSSDPKLTGEISIYMDGSVYPFAGLQRDKNRMKNSISGGLIGSDSALRKVSTLNTGNGFESFIAASEKPFRKDSNYYYFTLPVVTSGVDSWGIKTLSGKRTAAYEIPVQADESYSYTIALPSNLTLFTPVKKISVSNKAGSFVWEIKNDQGKLTVKRQIKFSDRIFPLPVFEDFKVLMDYWNNPWYRQVVLVTRDK